jgi:GTP-binding protein
MVTKMNIVSAAFIASSPNVDLCPKTHLPEIAFIGRSNVGKSSLINMVTGRKTLAKVSGTPGKTRMINHFLINEQWFLVDLPGLGFAKISRCEMNRLKLMIEGYLTHRKNLRMILLLVDSRHEPQQIDLDFIDWMIRHQLSFWLIFTKTDKLSKKELAEQPIKYREKINSLFGFMPEIILSSSSKRTGRDEILSGIEGIIS